MIRNDCCTSDELITICISDKDGNVSQYYKCPLCGRTYEEKEVNLYLNRKTNKKKEYQKFKKKHPNALILRESVYLKPCLNKNKLLVDVPVLSLGYIS